MRRTLEEHQKWLEEERDWGFYGYFDEIMGLAEYYLKELEARIDDDAQSNPIVLDGSGNGAMINLMLFITHYLPKIAGDKRHKPPYNLVYSIPSRSSGRLPDKEMSNANNC